MDEQIDGWKNEGMDGLWVGGLMDELGMDGQIDGWKNEGMDGWLDGWVDG